MTAVPAGSRGGVSRRRVLLGLLLGAPALVACSIDGTGMSDGPDPLILLADAARADAALAAAAIAATPELADRVQPLVDARTLHAAALDAEVTRVDPSRSPVTTAPPTPAADPVPVDAPESLRLVREAVLTSARDAGSAALDLPAERVGLVASVAACCSTYAAVLT